jgi:hypothetical protein
MMTTLLVNFETISCHSGLKFYCFRCHGHLACVSSTSWSIRNTLGILTSIAVPVALQQ